MFKPIIPRDHRAGYLLAIAGCVLVWAIILAVIHRLPPRTKRRLVVIVTFLSGLFYVLEFFLPAESRFLFFWGAHKNPFSPLVSPLGEALEVVFGFTFGLGLFNLCLVHGRVLFRRRAGWVNSLAFFVSMIAMMIFGLWQEYIPDDPSKMAVRFLHVTDHHIHRVHDYLFKGLYVPLEATMFSILAFYMATAAFRAFRIRTGEAAVMVVAAFVIMLGQVPVGMWVTHTLPTQGWLSFLRAENLAMWELGVIGMAGLRAVSFGIAVGSLAMALRLWLNLERGAFFEQEF